MWKYLLQRLFLAVPTVLLVTFMVFAITQLLPGDVAAYIAGVEATPADIERVRHEYRLDDPLPVQYASWLGRVVTGDFGRSARLTGIPVTTLLEQRLPATIELALLALAFSVIVSVPAGLLSALWKDSPFDLLITAGALAGISFPNFVFAYILIYVLAVKFALVPPSGYVSIADDPVGNLQRMLLPAIALAASTMAAQTRMLRTTALEVLRTDYVRTARAKGLSERTVLARHVLGNALIPFVTITGLQLAHLLSGAIIVETVFAVPGIGSLAIESIRSRDIPTLQAVVLVAVLSYLAITIVIDVVYAVLDPRIRFS